MLKNIPSFTTYRNIGVSPGVPRYSAAKPPTDTVLIINLCNVGDSIRYYVDKNLDASSEAVVFRVLTHELCPV